MAIANKVDTVYIQGLIYATYYHNQTSRRMLTDPKYETLGSRLQAAQKIIKKLNAAGIKVVYQMGDEEYNLYLDLFKIYVEEKQDHHFSKSDEEFQLLPDKYLFNINPEK